MSKENLVILDKEEFENLRREKLNYAFDSLYFRYAEAVDEIAFLKNQIGKPVSFASSSNRKMHFYMILEDILKAHSDENKIIRGK